MKKTPAKIYVGFRFGIPNPTKIATELKQSALKSQAE